MGAAVGAGLVAAIVAGGRVAAKVGLGVLVAGRGVFVGNGANTVARKSTSVGVVVVALFVVWALAHVVFWALEDEE